MKQAMTEEERIQEAKNKSRKHWQDQNRKRINEYHRTWSKHNPDKIKRYQSRYWLKKAAELLDDRQS
jgi:hypothetical protein